MTLGAIFDMDGVLVDSSEAHYASWKQLGEEIGTPFVRDFFVNVGICRPSSFGSRRPTAT